LLYIKKLIVYFTPKKHDLKVIPENVN